jgi:hypothetical protein
MRRVMVGSAALFSVLLISGCSNLPFGGGDRSDRMERSTTGTRSDDYRASPGDRSTTGTRSGDYRTSPGTSRGIPGSGPMGTTPDSRTY